METESIILIGIGALAAYLIWEKDNSAYAAPAATVASPAVITAAPVLVPTTSGGATAMVLNPQGDGTAPVAPLPASVALAQAQQQANASAAWSSYFASNVAQGIFTPYKPACSGYGQQATQMFTPASGGAAGQPTGYLYCENTTGSAA